MADIVAAFLLTGMADQNEILRKHNLRVMDRLNCFGTLGSKTIASRCGRPGVCEKDILPETGAPVTHPPPSPGLWGNWALARLSKSSFMTRAADSL